MKDETRSIDKWVIGLASVIAITCLFSIPLVAYTTYACPVIVQKASVVKPNTEIDVKSNLTVYSDKDDPSPPTTNILEEQSFSIIETETYESDETRTNTSLNNNKKKENFQEWEDSAKAVNEIKSKIRKILTAITPNGTEQEKDFQYKVTKLMLYIVSETNPNMESSMIKTLSKIVADERKSHIANHSSDKTQLVDLNIEKKINGIGFAVTKDFSSDKNAEENDYFLDFQTKTTGISSAHVRPVSTSQEAAPRRSVPENTNSVPDFEQEVIGIGFSTNPENTNGLPDVKREVNGVRSPTKTGETTSNEPSSMTIDICIVGNYVVITALSVMFVLSIITIILMAIRLRKRTYTVTEPDGM